MSTMLTHCKLTMAGQVDASSVATIVRDVVAGLPGDATTEQKVLALYRYVRSHLFAFVSTMDDTIEVLNKAIWTLNWWGFGLCGRQAKTLAMLAAHLLGHENVRIVGMSEREVGAWRCGQGGRPFAFVWTPTSLNWRPDQVGGHTSMEIRWDGTWHFLDVMVGFYRRDKGGRIVALQEILDNPVLADTPVGDPHGDMPYGPEPEIFTRSVVKHFHQPYNVWPGELPALSLRPGESFTFLASPLPGEFVIHPKMRAMFQEHVGAGGPREARPNAPRATWGNGEHRLRITLRPGDAYWCAESADWRMPVELPYPISSIHWEMTPSSRERKRAGAPQEENSVSPAHPHPQPLSQGERGEDAVCSGFLFHPPSTGDELMPITAAGSHKPSPQANVGRGYELVVRPATAGQPVDLTLRTIVQQNSLVVPRLVAGENRVRLSAQGDARLVARLTYDLAGQPAETVLRGPGEHVVTLPSEPARQAITLANEPSAGQ